VIPEALAAWYDYVIQDKDEVVTLDKDRVSQPVAIIDIGGRTTDYVVVKDQAILHGSSGSLQCGMLNVKQRLADGIQARFDLETLSEQLVSNAVERNRIRLQGRDHDVKDLAELLTAPKVDRAAIESFRAERIERLDQLSERLVDVVAQAGEVLTEEQRVKVAEMISERRGKGRRWHRRH